MGPQNEARDILDVNGHGFTGDANNNIIQCIYIYIIYTFIYIYIQYHIYIHII